MGKERRGLFVSELPACVESLVLLNNAAWRAIISGRIRWWLTDSLLHDSAPLDAAGLYDTDSNSSSEVYCTTGRYTCSWPALVWTAVQESGWVSANTAKPKNCFYALAVQHRCGNTFMSSSQELQTADADSFRSFKHYCLLVNWTSLSFCRLSFSGFILYTTSNLRKHVPVVDTV